jgi:O-antigen ligase
MPNNLLDRSIQYLLVLTGFFIPLSITATDVGMALLAVFGLFSGRFVREFDHIKKNPVVWCALWFVLLVILAMSWSIAPWGERLSALHKYAKLLYIPFLLAVCTDAKWRDRAILAFLLGVLITVILSYLKAWTGLPIGSNPNPAFIFYTHIETGFLVAFGAYLLALLAWKTPRWRIAYVILIILFSYQEFFINDGRTGWVAYLLLLVLFAIQKGGWKGMLLGIGGMAILLSTLFYTSRTFEKILTESTQEIVQYQQGYGQTSLGYRLSFNTLSWRLIKQAPILGYGTGSFKMAAKQLGGVTGWRLIKTPHNEYLMVAVEFGVVGLLSLLLLFAVQWIISFRLGDMQHFAQGLLLVFMVSSLYNAFLYLSVSGHFFVFFTALFFGQYRHNFAWKPGISGL